MRKITLLCCFLMLHLFSFAQNEYDNTTHTWHLTNYIGNGAVVLVNNNTVKVQKEGVHKEFTIAYSNNAFALAHPADSISFLKILEVDAGSVWGTFADALGKSAAEKLINLANASSDKKIILETAPATDIADTSHIARNIEEGAVVVADTTSNKYLKWLIPIAAAILGIGIGYSLKKGSKLKHPTDSNRPYIEKEPTTTLETDTDNIKKLKADNKQLKEQLKTTRDKTTALIDGDTLYYTEAFNKIILPLQQAIDNGDKAQIAEALTLAGAHFSSITRIKIRKKLKFDEANVQFIIGNPTLSTEYMALGKDTPIDRIPKNMRNFIAYLQNNGVSGLDDTVINGYKIKNI